MTRLGRDPRHHEGLHGAVMALNRAHLHLDAVGRLLTAVGGEAEVAILVIYRRLRQDRDVRIRLQKLHRHIALDGDGEDWHGALDGHHVGPVARIEHKLVVYEEGFRVHRHQVLTHLGVPFTGGLDEVLQVVDVRKQLLHHLAAGRLLLAGADRRPVRPRRRQRDHLARVGGEYDVLHGAVRDISSPNHRDALVHILLEHLPRRGAVVHDRVHLHAPVVSAQYEIQHAVLSVVHRGLHALHRGHL
mmetsp:Transcript_45285/g.75537  ORF Transcript_45285/g.75537 Transcript_45285/m.75537 type:complete len:245 (-) Transcript_45285:1195-1929(-)